MTNKQLENYVNCICNIKLKDGTKYTRKRVHKVGEIFVIKGTIDKQLKVSEIKSIEKVIVDTTATYDNYVYETIEEHIKKVSKRNIKTNQICVSFVVKYSGKFAIARAFETLEEAKEFKRICEENIRKHKLTESINNTKENVIDEDQLLEYPETLLKEIGIFANDYANYYTEIVPNFEENFAKASAILSEREIECVKLRYKNLLTLEEIGKSFGTTRERVRQIINKSIRKLKHPSSKDFLIKGTDKLELINAQERKELYEKLKQEMTYEIALQIVQEHKKEEILHYTGGLESINDLDLSVRSWNCLRRAGIETIEELINKTEVDMMKVRNLGRKSLKEIKGRIADFGLSFKDSLEEF